MFAYETKIIHDSEQFYTKESCNRILVRISMEPHELCTHKESFSYAWNIEDIYDLDAEIHRKIEDFSEQERKQILAKCDKKADDESYKMFLEMQDYLRN